MANLEHGKLTQIPKEYEQMHRRTGTIIDAVCFLCSPPVWFIEYPPDGRIQAVDSSWQVTSSAEPCRPPPPSHFSPLHLADDATSRFDPDVSVAHISPAAYSPDACKVHLASE